MATFDSVNPARPSEVIGTFPVQGAADVDLYRFAPSVSGTFSVSNRLM